MFLAHSPKTSLGVPAQSYRDHIHAVVDRACKNAKAASGSAGFASLLENAVRQAAEYHDLGKLDPLNQSVLSADGKGHLPLNHVDAGVAQMLHYAGEMEDTASLLAALLIYSHHRGLPDYPADLTKDLRDTAIHQNVGSIKERTDQWLERYVDIHIRETNLATREQNNDYKKAANMKILYRMALSCLVDADHFDTSRHYVQSYDTIAIPLQAVERLRLLDSYVAVLEGGDDNDRNRLRSAVYRSCRNSKLPRGMVACDSPVGSGKTTAVMAHLLNVASENNMRRVFVVLPYTNIISQNVEVYRKSIVFPDENGEHVVAAHHHRAEFTEPESRHLTYLWEAPIVVTTAVQFFETLASAKTGSIRKLHQLANSAVFIDEAHAALPSHLWPVAWNWLQFLKKEWNCHVVLGSGSLSQFWTLPEFSNPPAEVPNLVDFVQNTASAEYETQRITYGSVSYPLSLGAISSFLSNHPGPRLFIVNTVQSAAFIAQKLAFVEGRLNVEHLSTALTPNDREATLKRVKARLQDGADTKWTLVATSCVEAGVDISFRTGFRERSSLNSLLQTAGRVNRDGRLGKAFVWDFRLVLDHCLRRHPAFEDSAIVLGELFNEDKVSADYCTESMRRELGMAGGVGGIAKLVQAAEGKMRFAEVADTFRVIDSNSDVAVVDKLLISRLRNREKVSFQELQGGSVQIYSNKRLSLALSAIVERPGIYEWTLKYDSFLGYMAGVIENINLLNDGCAFG